MRKFLQSVLLTLAVIAAPTVAFAQVDEKSITTSGADCSTSTNCAIFGVRGYASIGIYLNVGSSGTFEFEATTGDDPETATWFGVTDDVGDNSNATADGALFFSNPGYSYIRLRASAISGAATVTVSRGFAGLKSTATLAGAAQGDGAIQDGSNSAIEATVFDLTNSNPVATQIVDANGDAITSFGGGTQYTEDAAAAANPVGNALIGVRADTLSGVASADGDNIAARMTDNGELYVKHVDAIPVTDNGSTLTIDGTVTVTDGSGALNVIVDSGTITANLSATDNAVLDDIADGIAVTNAGTFAVQCSNCSGSGASGVDDAAFTVATDSVAPAGFLLDDTSPDTIDEGDVGLARMSANRVPYAQIRDAAGNERGANVNASGQLNVTGPVTNAGTFAVQESGSALTALQLIDNIVSVEDAVAGSAFSGVGMLAVRQDSHSDLAADGDFIPLTIDADGGLRVSIVAGAGSGGTAVADDADFTAGTTSFTPVGGFYQSTVTACTDGDACAAGITAQRTLKVTLYESDGSEVPVATTTEATHNGALTADSTIGTVSMAIAKDFDGSALPNAVTEGDAAIPAVSLNGVQMVMVVSEDGSLERGTSTTPMIVGDGSGALNVIVDSGTVTANLSATDNAVLDDIADGIAVTNAGTFAVQCSNCSGSGASGVDDAAFTIATDSVAPAGFLFDDVSPDSVNEGDVGLGRMSANRNQYVTLRDAAGNERGLNIDASGNLTANITGSVTVTDGSGALNTIVDSGTITTVSTVTTLSQFGGNAINLGAGSVGTGTLRTTLAADDPLVARRSSDPCTYGTKLVVAINQTTGTQLFTGTASNRTYICNVQLVTATAQNIALVSGTGTVCATSTGPLTGGTTAATGWNFAANGGISLGSGGAWIAKSDTDADNVCLLQSGSGQISGSLTYVVAAN